ncbi:MAG: mycofactocin biosynthesis peptidyl-dipeptidase MftE [Microthrixaceae bacterium]
MALHLAGLTWPEVPADSLLVVPVGSCEQHGPHLPMDTDLRIAVALCDALGDARTDVVVAPVLAVTASGEHQSFPGTLSIGTEATTQVVIELVRSALPPAGTARPSPFRAVVLVNGHGGNVEALAAAQRLLGSEGRHVTVWHPRIADGDSHAGATETSIMLHLHPDAVRVDRIEPGATARWRHMGPTVMEHGLAAVTANGILGDPTAATAEHGAELVGQLVDDLRRCVEREHGSR